MFSITTELFLQNYFLFQNLIGKLCDEELLFDKLYAVFLMPESEKNELFALTRRDEVQEIATYSDYAQTCRIDKYAELAEIDLKSDGDLRDMIAVKGDALRKIKQFGFDEFAVATETEKYKQLTQTANMGLIPSLCALGFLQCEGIFADKNFRCGIKNFERAAKWNSVAGILFALHYDEKKRPVNFNRLFTMAKGTLYEKIYNAAISSYGFTQTPKAVPEVKMLIKAFGAGILKPDVYASQYARFIYSEVLAQKDKERTLFSGHKEIIAETADLPLKLTQDSICFNKDELCDLPILRENEQDKIYRAMLNSDMRSDSDYRPLCICGESEYLVKLYLEAVNKALASAHIERIDVFDLNDYDFEPSKNHVFVRSCDEARQNVYFLYFKGTIREPIMCAVKNFLQSDKRRKTRLQHPSAIIDLSTVLPVCFCDKQNARLLKPYCDVITLAPVSAPEKPDMLAYILHAKSIKYKFKGVQADDSAQKMLAPYSVDKAEKLIDKAVRYHIGEDTLNITEKMLQEYDDTGAGQKYGFMGANNESK